jgi:hypothetical protein
MIPVLEKAGAFSKTAQSQKLGDQSAAAIELAKIWPGKT